MRQPYQLTCLQRQSSGHIGGLSSLALQTPPFGWYSVGRTIWLKNCSFGVFFDWHLLLFDAQSQKSTPRRSCNCLTCVLRGSKNHKSLFSHSCDEETQSSAYSHVNWVVLLVIQDQRLFLWVVCQQASNYCSKKRGQCTWRAGFYTFLREWSGFHWSPRHGPQLISIASKASSSFSYRR